MVLACTHYPFLVNRMRKTAPWPVDWLDPAEAIARRAASLLSPLDGMAAEQAEDRAVFTSGTPDSATRRLMQGPNRPDAIFCWTDFIALEVISVVTELGLSIPDDLGIVGYDNTMFCDYAQNSLSSIDQSGELLGLQATRLLIERIKGRTEAEHFIVSPRLVARRSTGRATTGPLHPAV